MTIAIAATRGEPEGEDRRKAWLGAAFMSAICADVGFAWTPTSGENDIHSLDGSIAFWPGQSTPVQIKGTDQFVRSKSYRIRAAWRRNWGQLMQPSYFVVVAVPKGVSEWIYHHKAPRTLLECAAYWARIDQLPADQKSVQLVTERRLTRGTLVEWRDEALAHAAQFGG